jgi:JmjC domain
VTTTPTVTEPATGWLELDRTEWQQNYDRRPFTITHHLVDHPLMAFDAVCELVARLPEDQIEHNLGDIPEVLADSKAAPRLDLAPVDVARNIEHNGCWMVLKYVGRDPAYGVLVNQILDQVADALGDRGADRSGREAYVFMSGNASVTPTHCDPEHNFLLQVRGEKGFSAGAPPTPADDTSFLEQYYRHGQRNTPYAAADVTTYDLKPGVGLYLPPHRPHFVRSRSELTISLSVTWRPGDLRRIGRIYAFNGRRRDRGATPRPFGSSPALDTIKSTYEGVLSRIRTTLGRPRAAGVP